MGFYIRKSISFGPVRINLSKSGIGVSVGVKGARVGTGPRGSYIHAGRHGLYYRQRISPFKRRPKSPAVPVQQKKQLKDRRPDRGVHPYQPSESLSDQLSEEYLRRTLVDLDRGLALDPNNALGWSLKGAFLAMLGRHKEALAALDRCDRALIHDQGNALAWSNRGLAFYQLGHYEEALAAYDRSLVLDSNNASDWANKRNCAHELESS